MLSYPCRREIGPAIAAIVLLLLAFPLQAAEQNYCRVCHSEVEVQFRDSVHYKEDLTCTSCHGGDPSTTETERAHGGDFREAPSRAQIPEFCATCHSDPAQMRPYGIATDQYALYLTSTHGRKFSQGDTRVAVCTDCHGTHRILRRDAPDNPTGRLNISATCDRCHGDAALMAPYGLPTDIIEKYEASVHAQALRQHGDPQAPDCTRCHGSHGATPPGVGDIGKVCGQCHAQTRDAFRLSPHQQAMAAHQEGECAACHDNHRILLPTLDMWVSVCADCHDESSEAARTGEKILTLITQTEEEMDRATQAVDQARQIPLDVADYEARLNVASTFLVEAIPMSHSLDVASIDEFTRKSRSIAQEVQAEVHEKTQVFAGRGFVVIFVWLYILITVAAIQYYKRSLK